MTLNALNCSSSSQFYDTLIRTGRDSSLQISRNCSFFTSSETWCTLVPFVTMGLHFSVAFHTQNQYIIQQHKYQVWYWSDMWWHEVSIWRATGTLQCSWRCYSLHNALCTCSAPHSSSRGCCRILRHTRQVSCSRMEGLFWLETGGWCSKTGVGAISLRYLISMLGVAPGRRPLPAVCLLSVPLPLTSKWLHTCVLFHQWCIC